MRKSLANQLIIILGFVLLIASPLAASEEVDFLQAVYDFDYVYQALLDIANDPYMDYLELDNLLREMTFLATEAESAIKNLMSGEGTEYDFEKLSNQLVEYAEICLNEIVISPPENLRLNAFYEKYISASGIPIIGAAEVDSRAFIAAYRTINGMLKKVMTDIPSVHESLITNRAKFGIIGKNQVTTDLPEYAYLGPDYDWTRGLGGTLSNPLSSGAEENLLRMDNDPYKGEDIAIHEFAHGFHLIGVRRGAPAIYEEIRSAYNQALAEGLWKNTYSASNYHEYFAEGVQSWFNVNATSNRIDGGPDGVHNHVGTREALKVYDPRLYNILSKLFYEEEIDSYVPYKQVIADPVSKYLAARWDFSKSKVVLNSLLREDYGRHFAQIIGEIGLSGSGVVFNGEEQYLILGHDLLRGSEFTIMSAFKWAGGMAEQKLFDFGDADSYIYFTPKNQDGAAELVVVVNGEEFSIVTGAIPVEEWVELIITVSDQSVDLFINGQHLGQILDFPGIKLDLTTMQNYLAKGRYGGSFAGEISEFCLYNAVVPVKAQWASSVNKPFHTGILTVGTIQTVNVRVNKNEDFVLAGKVQINYGEGWKDMEEVSSSDSFSTFRYSWPVNQSGRIEYEIRAIDLLLTPEHAIAISSRFTVL